MILPSLQAQSKGAQSELKTAQNTAWLLLEFQPVKTSSFHSPINSQNRIKLGWWRPLKWTFKWKQPSLWPKKLLQLWTTVPSRKFSPPQSQLPKLYKNKSLQPTTFKTLPSPKVCGAKKIRTELSLVILTCKIATYMPMVLKKTAITSSRSSTSWSEDILTWSKRTTGGKSTMNLTSMILSRVKTKVSMTSFLFLMSFKWLSKTSTTLFAFARWSMKEPMLTKSLWYSPSSRTWFLQGFKPYLFLRI